MDLQYILNILWRRKWLLLAVALVTALTTWFLVGRLADTYKSTALIETNILNDTRWNPFTTNPFMQEFQIKSQFDQMTQLIASQKIIRRLQNRLLHHDLTAIGNQSVPFRVPSLEESNFTKEDLMALQSLLSAHYNDNSISSDSLNSKLVSQLNGRKYSDYAKAFGYDYQNLIENLSVLRVGQTDYIQVEFKSEDPKLSLYMTQSLTDEFLKNYEERLNTETNSTTRKLEEKVEEKERELESKKIALNDYRQSNTVLDVNKESDKVIKQIAQMEQKIEEERSKIRSLNKKRKILDKNISALTKKISNSENDGRIKNDRYDKLKKEIAILTDEYYNDMSNRQVEKKLKDKKEELEQLSGDFSLDFKGDNIDFKRRYEELTSDLLDTELSLEDAESAKYTYENELTSLEREERKLVSNDAEFQTRSEDYEEAKQAYDDANNALNQAYVKSEFEESPLAIHQPATLADKAESKQRPLLAIFGGVAGLTITSVLLFMLAFFDSSLSSPSQFGARTKLNLLGFINKLKGQNLDLNHVFKTFHDKGDLEFFKESIRKLRYQIETSSAKKFLFVSPRQQEGKSFLMLTLAYALSMSNKKVLIFDTNFKNNTLSGFSKNGTTSPLNGNTGQASAYANNNPLVASAYDIPGVDIIGNKGGSYSPSEVLAEKDFGRILDNYAGKYDYIFMEAASMNLFSDAQELMDYSDKVIAVFGAESAISTADKETINVLESMNGKFMGSILNKVNLKNV